MHASDDVAVSDAAPLTPSSAAPETGSTVSDTTGSSAPEIKVEPSDAILRFAAPPREEAKKAPKRNRPSVFGRILRFTARTAAVVSLCGLAWAAGASYSAYSLGHSPFAFLKPGRLPATQQGPKHDDVVRAMAQMGEDIRALKAAILVKAATQSPGSAGAGRAALGDLASRIDKLESDSATKLSHINDQLAGIEQQIAALHAAHAPHTTLAARAQTPHRRIEHHHDAFDPARDPTAPGAPRPLGGW